MRAGNNSKRLFGITRSKGKMYEFGLDETQHLKVPQGTDPLQLFLLTIGTLGDVAGFLAESEYPLAPLPVDLQSELNFCASFFDAVLDSKFARGLERTTLLLASAAYYLARRPGSSLVLARRIVPQEGDNRVEQLLQWLLRANWGTYWTLDCERYGSLLTSISRAIAYHFSNGTKLDEIGLLLKQLRSAAYKLGSPEELLYSDIALSICRMRLAASAWVKLPTYSGLPAEQWTPVIQKSTFPKELWPSQLLLGESGLFKGASGLVQMPTSAGKTRAIEIILRSAFMSGRTKLAVVVAPFRALCHEIAVSLGQDLSGEDIKVNELSDALQIDFVEQVAELLGSALPVTSYVLVLTPEKFLYVLRQSPQALKYLGLVIYDEGHQFDTGGRGITYELLLTEIKGLLPESAQTVLISAVMQNPQAIASWLMGAAEGQVIDGASLLPTSRSVAFASWTESLGQLMFYENGYSQQDYFVPRIIEAADLSGLKPVDSKFPARQKSSDVSLYLGLRVVNNGAVAIFCGTKLVANGIAKRAVQLADAGYNANWPANYADPNEVLALKSMIDGNFGSGSLPSKAATLGIYTHHSNTPHGIRLALEHGMQKGLISFIACTSTLAQGVNLPIRYLIVQGVNQGAGRVKVRDFQNLIGRAGRAGMHTEGVIIFADSTVHDNRRSLRESWKFQNAVELLSPDRAEGITSSLLLLLKPFSLSRTLEWRFSADNLLTLIDDESSWERWALELAGQVPRLTLPKKVELARGLRKSLVERKKMTYTLESYLMANCGTADANDFEQRAGELALETLAYSLATPDEASKLEEYFRLVARRVESIEKSPAKQAAFGKTLLGAKHAKRIEAWVGQHRNSLLALDSNENWLAGVWPLLIELCDNRFFRTVEPATAGYELAISWMRGKSYGEIFKQATSMQVKKQAGSRKQKVSDDDILDFLESALAFDCALILAAIAQFLFTPQELSGDEGESFAHFQKSLKTGLPDILALNTYGAGFADRFLAQAIRDALLEDGFQGDHFEDAKKNNLSAIQSIVASTPAYFSRILNGAGVS